MYEVETIFFPLFLSNYTAFSRLLLWQTATHISYLCFEVDCCIVTRKTRSNTVGAPLTEREGKHRQHPSGVGGADE